MVIYDGNSGSNGAGTTIVDGDGLVMTVVVVLLTVVWEWVQWWCERGSSGNGNVMVMVKVRRS